MTELDSIMVELFQGFFRLIFTTGTIMFLLGIAILVGTVALITWVIKKVWYADKKQKIKPKRKGNDWLTNAMNRENKRFEASRPRKAKPERTWYPTGWTWNDKTKKWEPPDFLVDESHSRWKWDEEKKIWVDKIKEQKMAKYREYRKDKEPTYEEWKAAKQAEQNNPPEE